MDMPGYTPAKLEVLLSSIISVERQLHAMDGELASNAATNLQTSFGCALPEYIEIHRTSTSLTKGR